MTSPVKYPQPQRILVFSQGRAADNKIAGIRTYAPEDLFDMTVVRIPSKLPLVIDDSEAYLPDHLTADLVLDFLKHPDLTHDLAQRCLVAEIPLIASGRKPPCDGVLAPPT